MLVLLLLKRDILICFSGKKPAPKFTQPLEETQATIGSTARLTCRLNATAAPNIEWTKNGRPVVESRRVQREFEGDLISLVISDTRPEDSGEYQCLVKNKSGTASCRTRLVVSESASTPELKKVMNDLELLEGDEAVFEISVSAKPVPEVQWFLRKMPIKNEGKYTIDEDSERQRYSLTISDCRKEDSGQYRCQVTNSAGEVTCSAELKVSDRQFAPTFVQGTDQQLFEVWEGAPVKLVVQAKGKPTPQVEWFKESRLARRVKRVELQTEGDKSILLIPKAVPDDSGNYRVEAANSAGTAVKPFVVKVNGRFNNKFILVKYYIGNTRNEKIRCIRSYQITEIVLLFTITSILCFFFFCFLLFCFFVCACFVFLFFCFESVATHFSSVSNFLFLVFIRLNLFYDILLLQRYTPLPCSSPNRGS